MPTSTLAHVILISFYADASQAERETTLSDFRQLGDRCGGRDAGILYWRADWNQDQRKNFQVMAMAIFADQDALSAYRLHPGHKAFAEALSRIADWIVGDLKMNANDSYDAFTQWLGNS